MDFKDAYTKSILTFIRNPALNLFYAIYNSVIKRQDDSLQFPAGVSYDKSTGKFILHINPEYLKTITNSDYRNVGGVILHEMLHLMLKHVGDAEKFKNHPKAAGLPVKTVNMILNMAQDHVINRAILKDIEKGILPSDKIALPNLVRSLNLDGQDPRFFIIPELIDENLSVLQVFEYILDKFESDNQPQNFTPDVEYHDGSSDGSGEGSDLDSESGKSIAAAEKELEQMVRAAHEILKQGLKNRGLEEGNIFQLIKDILEPKIPIERVIERAIRSLLIKTMESRSWTNYNKKLYSATNIMLPGPGIETQIGKIVFAVDCSGSMNDDELRKCLGIIVKSVDHVSDIIIIYHDTEIRSVITLQKEEFNIDRIAKIPGRGGTSHKDVFDMIEKLYVEDDIDLIVFLTDHESDIEDLWNSYHFHQYVPTVFIIPYKYNGIRVGAEYIELD